jgi:hypothetical protein
MIDLKFSWQPKQTFALALLENDYELIDKSILHTISRSDFSKLAIATVFGFGGSNGGSKSDLSRKAMLYRRLKYPGTRGLLLRRTYGDVYDNHVSPYLSQWPIMRDWWDEKHKAFFMPNGSEIKCGYADRKGDVETAFQGQGFMDVFPDEASHFFESDLTYLKIINRSARIDDRMCKMLMTLNPCAEGHANVGFTFLKRIFNTKEYHENEEARDYAFLPSYAWDNVEWSRFKLESEGLTVQEYYSWTDEQRFKYFLQTGYGHKLDTLPQTLRVGRLLGSWDQFGGQYFDFFDSVEHVSLVPPLQTWYSRWLSVDYGFDHNSAVYWHTTLPDGRIATYDEFVDNAHTPRELAQAVAVQNKGQTLDSIYVDPTTDSEKDKRDTIFQQLSRAFEEFGLPNCSHANNERKGGWMLCYDMLKTGGGIISPKCVELVKTIPAAMRKEDDREDVQKFDGDDPIDSWRYGWKSRLDPAQAPLEVRMTANLEDLESKRDQYGKPWSRTAIMQQLEKRRKQEEEATEGQPWTLKVR